MENKFIMASDVIHAFNKIILKHGDCPVAIMISQLNEIKDIAPVKNIHTMSIKDERLIVIANFTITNNEDGSSMGYLNDK